MSLPLLAPAYPSLAYPAAGPVGYSAAAPVGYSAAAPVAYAGVATPTYPMAPPFARSWSPQPLHRSISFSRSSSPRPVGRSISIAPAPVLRSTVNWASVNAALPYEQTPAAKRKRNKLFRDIDINGNDYLSLAEVDKGLRDNIRLLAVFDSKPAIMRAFQAAKNFGGDVKGIGVDYIDKREFRIFLQYLRGYFELYEMFKMIDVNSDRRVSLDEFCESHALLTQWGLNCPDPATMPEIFAQIDTNGGGMILFSEFCDWAISQKLDLGEEDNRDILIPVQNAPVEMARYPLGPTVGRMAAAPMYLYHPPPIMFAASPVGYLR